MCIYTVLPHVSSPARPAVSCPDISGWHIGDAASFNLFIWEAVHRTASQRHSDWESAGRDRFSSDLGMSASGRQPPVIILSRDRPLLGESGHWDASSKSHVYDIRERQLSARSCRCHEALLVAGWHYLCGFDHQYYSFLRSSSSVYNTFRNDKALLGK